MKYKRLVWVAPFALIVLMTTVVVLAQAPFPRQLIATGSGFYQQPDPLFTALKSIGTQSNRPEIEVLVLPVGTGSDPNAITEAERTAQLKTAEQLRQAIEANCQAVMPQEVTCSAMLVPAITRPDVLAVPALGEYSSNPDAIYFLEDNALKILESLQGSALADDITFAYQSGTILIGPGDLFTDTFIHGYRPKFGPASVMTFGAVRTENTPGQGGLAFFPRQAVVDTNPFSGNRLGRLLNSITGPEAPRLGIGIEANTSFILVEDSQLMGFSGESVVMILDAETYQSANAVTYQPVSHLIGIRNVLLHMVAPGTTTYHLDQRQNSHVAITPRFTRDFDGLRIPAGAGTLMLTSNLLSEATNLASLIEFTNMSGGRNARLLILAAGYPDLQDAEADAQSIAKNLAVPSEIRILQAESAVDVTISPEITGIILTGMDASLIELDSLSGIKDVWLSGMPILADRAGATILGVQYPTSSRPGQELPPFSPGRFQSKAGLGFIQANIDPGALEKYGWERIFTTAYQSPQQPVIGLAAGGGLKFDSNTTEVLGTNIVAVVDFRYATLATGETGILEIANGMLDIYTPGEHILSSVADTAAAPIHAPTPVLEVAPPSPVPSPTATIVQAVVQPEPTEAPQGKPPTRTPRPTGTPVPTPPPADPGTTNLMVFFGVLAVVVVIVGLWLNRNIAAE